MSDETIEIQLTEFASFPGVQSRFNQWVQRAITKGWKVTEQDSNNVILSRKSRKGLMCLPIMFIAIFLYYAAMYGFFASLIVLPVYAFCAFCGYGMTKNVVIDADIKQDDRISVVIHVVRPEKCSTEAIDALKHILTSSK